MKSSWNMVIPVISTAHAPSDEAFKELIAKNFLCAPYEYGYFVFIENEEQESEPEWFAEVRRWRESHYGNDCREHRWIRFDCDGDVIDELQKWDW